MEELKKSEDHMQSAAAFVEGGILEACDDACSICLEAFCESEPSTLTSCKHEFHLQCVLEWCQRSSNCPMCWQNLSLKEPSSQELLEAVEQERSIRSNPSMSSAVFHHPTFGNFELQNLPVGVTEAELEERIVHHLAVAAAMGRARRTARREAPQSRSSAHNRPQPTVFPTLPNSGSMSSLPSSGEETQPTAISAASPLVPFTDGDEQIAIAHTDQTFASASASPILTANQGNSVSSRHPGLVPNQDKAGPSDLQSSIESLKSRFSTMSMRYKETISKSTRGWREKLFSRNSSSDSLAPESRRESDSGVASISHMMERSQASREDNGDNMASASPVVSTNASMAEDLVHNNVQQHGTTENDGNTEALAASSVPHR